MTRHLELSGIVLLILVMAVAGASLNLGSGPLKDMFKPDQYRTDIGRIGERMAVVLPAISQAPAHAPTLIDLFEEDRNLQRKLTDGTVIDACARELGEAIGTAVEAVREALKSPSVAHGGNVAIDHALIERVTELVDKYETCEAAN